MNSSKGKPQYRGLFCEQTALKHYLQQNYHVLAHRHRTPFGELDLIFYSPSGSLVLVEVKSQAHPSFEADRVSWKQKQRLLRNYEYVASRSCGLDVELHLAIVSHMGEVTIFDNWLG